MRKIITASPNKTQSLAGGLAKKILSQKTSRKSALIIGLTGNLGSGKTTFIQGFAKGLGIKQKIISPTFVIMKSYKLPVFTANYKLIHIDAYRLENPKELINLDWNELIKNPYNIVLVEWADKIKKILPKNSAKISFKSLDKNKREIEITGNTNLPNY